MRPFKSRRGLKRFKELTPRSGFSSHEEKSSTTTHCWGWNHGKHLWSKRLWTPKPRSFLLVKTSTRKASVKSIIFISKTSKTTCIITTWGIRSRWTWLRLASARTSRCGGILLLDLQKVCGITVSWFLQEMLNWATQTQVTFCWLIENKGRIDSRRWIWSIWKRLGRRSQIQVQEVDRYKIMSWHSIVCYLLQGEIPSGLSNCHSMRTYNKTKLPKEEIQC